MKNPLSRRVCYTYYRVKAIHPDITLKDVCDRMGANYTTVRNYKVKYDKARHDKAQRYDV